MTDKEMARLEIINQYQDTIRDIYDEENLKCLRGDNDSYKIKDKPILLWHSQVTRKCKITYGFEQFENIDDLLLCSDEIMHFTAQLYLFRPYLNNPLKDAFKTDSGMVVYPNNQNLAAKRYYIYSDIVSEKLYNYWQRIGNLIGAFFPKLINPDRVYFSSAFDIIPKEYHHLDSYKWLKNFRDTTFKQINDKRREVVHYSSSDTDLKYKHIFSRGNQAEIEKWVNERHEIPDFFKMQIELSLEGFYQTMLMLEEIDKVIFKDVK